MMQCLQTFFWVLYKVVMVIRNGVQLHKLDMFRSDKTFQSCSTTHLTLEYIRISTLQLGNHSGHKLPLQKYDVLLEKQ